MLWWYKSLQWPNSLAWAIRQLTQSAHNVSLEHSHKSKQWIVVTGLMFQTLVYGDSIQSCYSEISQPTTKQIPFAVSEAKISGFPVNLTVLLARFVGLEA